MIKRIETSGPAFPRPASEFTKNGTLPDGNDAVPEQDGMSLRDYFAAKAMQGEIVSQGLEGRDVDGIALMAYEMADAMIHARRPTAPVYVAPPTIIVDQPRGTSALGVVSLVLGVLAPPTTAE